MAGSAQVSGSHSDRSSGALMRDPGSGRSVPKGPTGKGEVAALRMCLAPAIWPDGPAPKGQESLAQVLPWVSRYNRFALKGL
jgi:hypothetical protein